MKKPLWIIVEGLFEGHQGHWADCYHSNASIVNIIRALGTDFGDVSWTIRPMTDKELATFPEAVKYIGWYE